ncbi:MAG: hypothetical protein JSU73_14215, partial [candidate division WOR-3 bacterium]
IGASLLLALAMAYLGWRLMGNPAVFVAILPVLFIQPFQRIRRKSTYSRLGCPDHEPTDDVRFFLILLTAFAVLGVVAMLVVSLRGIGSARPVMSWAPVWIPGIGFALLCLLGWWYRSARYFLYAALLALSVAAAHLLRLPAPLRLAGALAVAGVAMTTGGTLQSVRFLRNTRVCPGA